MGGSKVVNPWLRNKKKPEIDFDIHFRFTASLAVASVLAATYFITAVYSA